MQLQDLRRVRVVLHEVREGVCEHEINAPRHGSRATRWAQPGPAEKASDDLGRVALVRLEGYIHLLLQLDLGFASCSGTRHGAEALLRNLRRNRPNSVSKNRPIVIDSY